MAWQFNVNVHQSNVSLDDGQWWYTFIQWLVTQPGFELIGSSDGRSAFELQGQTSGSGTGVGGAYDVLATSGVYQWPSSVDGDWANTNAWIIWRQTGSTREWAIQRSNSAGAGNSRNFRLAYAPDGFNLDAGLTTLPTAPELQYLFGSASGLYTIGNTGADVMLHMGAENEPVNDVYSWYVLQVKYDTQDATAFVMCDALRDTSIGDPEPDMFVFAFTSYTVGTVAALSYLDRGGPREEWDGYTLLNMGWFPRSTVSEADGALRSFPVLYGSTIKGHFKGASRNLRMNPRGGVNYPTTFNLATSDAVVAVGDFLLPWPQGVIPK